MSDKAFERMIEVPGMKVQYHVPLTEGGRVILYEVALDRTEHLDDLNRLFDTMRMAAERQKAFHDLPIHKMRLAQNEARLPGLQKQLAYEVGMANKRERDAEQRAQARGRERRVVEMNTAPPGQNAVATLEADLKRLVDVIEADRLEIPRLQAIIDGEPEPPPKPDLVEPIVIGLEAAE